MSFELYSKWWIVSKKELEDLFKYDEEARQKFAKIKSKARALKLLGYLYAKYCLLIKNMGPCVDLMAQPQKRACARKLMDAAAIRLHEINDNLREINISEYHYVDGNLIELKVVPHEIQILHSELFYPRPLNIEDLIRRVEKGEKLFTFPEEKAEPTVVKTLMEQLMEEQQRKEAEEEAEEEEEDEGDEETEYHEPTEAEIKAAKAEERRRKRIERQKRMFVVEETLSPEEIEQRERKKLLDKWALIIQTAERARAARLYMFDKAREKQKSADMKTKKPLEESQMQQQLEESSKAVTTLQKYWRGRTARKKVKLEENKRRLLIGMTEPSWRSREEFEKIEKSLEIRREYRDQRMKEYLEAIDQEKARLLRVIAPGLLEDITDEIRAWFRNWYDVAKWFDKYPDEDEGGTVIVIRGETMTPKEWLTEEYRKKKEKGNKAKQAMAAKKKKEEEAKKAAEEKKKKEAEKKKKEAAKKKKHKKGMKKFQDFEFEFPEEGTKAKPFFDDAEEEFESLWNHRKDEDNPLEKHYMDLITDDECCQMQLDLRKEADEMMRLELDQLWAALEKDRIKELGRKKGKIKKQKKKKKKKKKKKRGKKDMTKNKSTEELYQELINNNIICQYPEERLESYLGDFSYNNYELRNMDIDPPATLLDVRQAVLVNCILPLGVGNLKRPRSVLLLGPRQTGKHLLARAIFNETKCVLFDISPEKTAGKYEGKKGMKMLLHLLDKMSKLLAPSIIYVDGAERLFYKKVPKEEKELDPKRLGKKLYKGVVKAITPSDRVLVLGTCGRPWLAGAKMKKAFERVILIPRPDYNSVYMYWRHLLMSKYMIDRDFNVTSISTVTKNYPFSELKKCLDTVLNTRRLIQLQYRPLQPQELYEYFVSNNIEPITDKEWNKFIKWYYKTPLGRERKLFNKFADIKREQERQAKEKAAEKAAQKK